jgi:Ca2+-binding RTX toxin-like protein
MSHPFGKKQQKHSMMTPLKKSWWAKLPDAMRTKARPSGIVRDKRGAVMEVFEPRLLMSADAVLAGSQDAIMDGLTAAADEIGALITENTLFDNYVPGVLVIQGSGEDATEVSPTLEQALRMTADVSVTQGPGVGSFNTFDYSGATDNLVARYEYLTSDFSSPGGNGAVLFLGSDGVNELVLRAIDIDNNSTVSLEEAFKVLVVGQISSFLANTTPSDVDGLATTVEDFLDGDLLLNNFGVPDSVDDFFSIDVNAPSTVGNYDSDTGTLQWDMDFSLTMHSLERFDLGYEADQLGIALDPSDPLNNPGVVSTPTKVDLQRTIQFDSFIFGLRDADSAPVDSGDFFFAVPGANNMRLGVGFTNPTGDNALTGANINIGFLGATITAGTATLDMDTLGTAVDPSNPDALGFSLTQQGVAQLSGTLLADGAPVLADLDAADIEFSLKVGTGLTVLPTPITLDNAATNNTIGEIVTSLNTAINNASSDLGSIVTATNVGGKVQLSLVSSNASPLGFANEQGGGPGQTVLTAANVSTLIGQAAAGQQVSFLLSLGGRVPKLVTVTGIQNDSAGPDGLTGDAAKDADNNTISAVTLRNALANALGIFGGEVTASVVGVGADRVLRLDGTGEVLEISHTLTLDTIEQITIEELGLGQVFQVAADPNASFHVDLAIMAKSGLTNVGGGNYSPSGTIKVDINPFGDGPDVGGDDDVGTFTVDDNGTATTSDDAVRATFALTDTTGDLLKGGVSDMQTMLDFNVISAADILGIVNQLGNYVERLGGTDLLQAFDLPFGDTSLADLLNFKDLIQDTLLIDDLDDGPTKSGAEEDVARLLEWIGPAGQEKLIARFGTAQQLEERLANVLFGLGVYASLGDARNAIDARVKTYTEDGKTKQDLLYNLKITDNIMPKDIAAQVPLDFELDLSPFANFETSGKIVIDASGEFGLTVGIKLGNAVDALDIVGTATDLLKDINSGAGITVNDNPAVTTLATIDVVTGKLVAIDPIIGRLSADAEFTITTFTGVGNTPTVYTVKVEMEDTLNNRTVADLVADINAAFAIAKVGGVTAPLTGIIMAESAPVINATDTARIILRAVNTNVNSFQTDALTNNTAYTELGFGAQRAAAVSLIAPQSLAEAAAAFNASDATPASPGVNVSFTIDVTSDGGVLNSYVITVPTSATNDNVSLASLIADINAAINTAVGSNNVLIASQSGGRIAISAVSDDVRFFKLTSGSGADRIGFGASGNILTAGVTLRGGAAPSDPFGRLAAPVTFSINGQALTIALADTSSNTSIDDLIADINAAIAALPGGNPLPGKIEAFNDGYRIAFRAIDPSIGQIVVNNLSSTESAALGFANNSTTGGSATRPGLTLASSLSAPVSYGVSADTTFNISINGGSAVTATLLAENTILNRSLYDLAADINSAMNGAFLGQANNPLIATVQGGQIVIGVRTAASGANLIGDPYAPLPDVTSFSISADGASKAATELKLVATGAGTQTNSSNGYDFVIYFADGSKQGITLDTIAGITVNSDNKLVGNLKDLVAGIELQAPGKLDITVGPDGTSLRLHDLTAGLTEFRVIAVNGSPAALQLGILGKDTSNLNLNEVAAGTLVPDGFIDGARIATVDLLERVYLSDAGLKASLTVKTPDAVSAEATFGFVGVNVSTIAGQTLFSANLDMPFLQDEVTLDTLFSALDDDAIQTLLDQISAPSLTVGAVDHFDLNVALIADPSGDMPAISLGDAKIRLNLNSLGALGILTVDSDGNPLPAPDLQISTLPDIDVDLSTFDLGELANFDTITFDKVIDALKAISGFLDQFAAFSFLDDDIPILGLSVNDLLDVADRFAQAVADIESNPSGGLQALGQKIREAFGLPDLSGPELTAFFTNLGIPDPTKLIQFALDGGDILRFDLRLPIGFSEGLSVDLDLGDVDFLGGALPVDLQGGAGLSTSGFLDARLSFGIDLNDPTQFYIYDDATGIFGHLGASANNIAFNAAIGPMGIFVKDGQIVLDLDFNLDNGSFDAASGSKVLVGDFLADLADFNDGSLLPELTGTAKATLPVYFPTDSDFIGDIKLDISGANAFMLDPSNGLQLPDFSAPGVLTLPDFSNIDLSSINPFGSIPLMLDTLDFFLQGLQDVLSGEVFGIEIPFIGTQLQGGADFIEDLREDILGPIRQFVEQAPDLGEELVQALLYELLGAGSAQGTVGGQNVEDVIGIGGDILGIGLLKDYFTGSTALANITQDDIVASHVGLEDFLWKFRLGQTFSPTVPIDFDLGIPALSLDMDADLEISVGWDLALGLGIGTAEGAYIFLGNHREEENAGDNEELQLTIDVDIANDPNPIITGTLGFLQLNITEDGFEGDATEGLEEAARGTYFHAEFTVDLFDSSADTEQEQTDRLSFAELGSIDATIDMTAEAEVNLKLEAEFNPAIVPDSISALLPSVNGRFVLDFETGPIFADQFDFGDSLNLLGFRDVSIDMGSFISDFLGPFVSKISEITGPLQPIIDVITTPIPVLSDLAGTPITLVDIAGMTGYVEPAMIYAIADIISLVNKIGDASSYGEFLVPLGDFMILDNTGPGSGYLTGDSLLSPGFSLSNAEQFDKDHIGSFLASTQGALDTFSDLLTSGSGDSDSKNLVSGLSSGTEAASSGFAFPLFDDPSLIFGLLLGQDIPLVTYDLAPFGMEFTYVQKFPIWGPLFARITGSAGLTIDLAFGYDTLGVREFASGDFSNPLDLLAGFYVSDTDQPTGEGTDVPELILKGEIFAGAELNLGVASAGAEGGIILTVNFDLYDPDSDGRVRVDELLGNFLYEFNYGSPALAPIAIFDVFGDVSAQLRIFIEALFFKKTFDITPPITLVEFSIPFEREPFLATERNDGSLLLNIGPNAAQRLNGDTRDIGETIYVKSVSDTEVLVWNGTTVRESDAQSYKIGANNVIVGFGGAGNDLIDLSQVTHNIHFDLDGNEGDDTLLGTQAGGTMRGGMGNDTLTGGDGIDLIIGGEGNDTLYGDNEDDDSDAGDIIFGDTGIFIAAKPAEGSNPATPNRYRSFVGEKDGGDTIYGRGGNDIIFGGGGIDLIEGNGGNDLILGDGGNFELPAGNALPTLAGGDVDISHFKARGAGTMDIIFGNAGNDVILSGAGNDLVDGGADSDTLDGGVGFDTLYGGSGADLMYGGDNDDIMFGYRDPQGATFGFAGETTDAAADGIDRMFGDEGNDYMRGQAANDQMHGGRGADIMFGDTNDDEIYGEAGGDIMFGGADNDWMDASEGSDIVFGDDGLVVYIDFAPGITDFNFTGSRIRYLNGDQLIGDSAESLIPASMLNDGGADTADDLATSQDLIVTAPLATDGADFISGGDGKDIVFGGGSNAGPVNGKFDTLFGDYDPEAGFSGPRPTGQDILIGDGGRVELFGRRNTLAAAVSNALDGVDHISGNDSGDYIFGGGEQDVIYGFADANAAWTDIANKQPLQGLSDNDVILGDNGEIHFNPNEVANRIIFITTTYVPGDSGKSDVIDGDFDNDIILGGLNSSSDVLNGDVGQDIIIGDQGAVYFDDNPATLEDEGDGNLDTLDLVRSFRDGIGGIDIISGDAGDDVLIGGTAGDFIYGDNATASNGANDGEDIMLGDNADIFLVGNIGRLLVQVAAMPQGTAVDLITTTDNAISGENKGGADTMSGNAGNDIMLGGVNNGGQDLIYGDRAVPTVTTISNDGDDIILGDNGLLDFTYLTDTDRNTLDLIRSFEDDLGGVDIISGNKGLDVAIGGTAGDTIFGDGANASAGSSDLGDLLLGDNADIFLVAKGGAIGGDLKVVLDAAVKTIRTTDEENPGYGGSDTISGNAGGDIIAGGVFGDTLYGDRAIPNVTTTANDGNDIILGDNGAFEWLSTGRLTEITGINIAANNALLYEKYNPGIADTDLTTLDLITTEQPNSGGRDLIYGDNGSDVVFGGTDADTIYGDDGNETGAANNNDLLFGDHGRLYPQFSALSSINSRNFFAIDIGNASGGEGDRIWGEEGNDIMLGQQGDDRMWGGSGDDDMIGGHNVAGGYDELTAPTIEATLDPLMPMNDVMDGGSGDDAMAGDNAIIWRRGDDVSLRFRQLTGSTIYTTDEDSITANIGNVGQSDPDDAVGRDIQLLDHSDAVEADPQGRFGVDVMAGGADSDVMFGQLGNDLMQGDGLIQIGGVTDGVWTTRQLNVTDSGLPSTAGILFFKVPEQGSDADDYMEGNGGSDLIYGGLGQDDLIGGSSALFGLTTEVMRPDGADIIFGGAGAAARIARNDFVGSTDTDVGTAEGVGGVATNNDSSISLANRHSRDADFIMGDNANIYRLVGISDNFRTYNYDLSYYDANGAYVDRGNIRIVPRAMEQLDYSLGGADYNAGEYVNGAAQLLGQAADNGAGDLIHGESGDDYIFGMTGSDVIFGESDDDDIIGGYGNDWISGGTGLDGILGDDGLLYTSRNSTDGESLYGVAALLEDDPRPKYADGNVLNEIIKTPGEIQYAVINIVGELKKTVDIVPFSYDHNWIAQDDEYPDNANNTPFADDIIFGGLGSDWLHGASGDDAISGAEALEDAYVPVFDANGNPIGILNLGYNAFSLTPPINPGDSVANPNPGDVLAFNTVDLDGQHLNNRFRAGEFFLYDEYDPRLKILLNVDGTLNKDGTGVEFLLNFDETEGVYRPAGSVPKATGQQTSSYGAVNDDGKDAIFGDLGNDWLVGGTGRDNLYGGWGNDLLNADDYLDTLGTDGVTVGANDKPDTHPTYEDRAYGGAGRDVLIGNTGGDRLIDWVGEYNSYLVPYAPFGQASVSRSLQPFLPEFLYALSFGDGADPTRPAGLDPVRNGEPDGELGLVLQKDYAWQDQTGAPADPQAGNIPGGPRDVLRSAGFNDGTLQGFAIDSGVWELQNGALKVSAASLGKDAAAVFNVNDPLPVYFELLASVKLEKPTAGWKANSFILFDYQSETDFKFAGIDGSTNKLVMGHRTEAGWIYDVQTPFTVKIGTLYSLKLAVNGLNATLVVNNNTVFSYTYQARIIDGISYTLNAGMVGVGSNNARGSFDNIIVQILPPQYTFQRTEDFSDNAANDFSVDQGTWQISGSKYNALANSGGFASSLMNFTGVDANSYLELSAVLNTNDRAGFVFDYYNKDDFKFVAIDADQDKLLIGHYNLDDGWQIDAVVAKTINNGVNYNLGITIHGSTVTVKFNGAAALSRVYNSLLGDGWYGLFGLGVAGQVVGTFDNVTVKTDEAGYAQASVQSAAGVTALTASQSPSGSTATSELANEQLQPLVQVAIAKWVRSGLIEEEQIKQLRQLNFEIGDLDGLALGQTDADSKTITVDINGAGYGWFIDRTPNQDREFVNNVASEDSDAYGKMDLLSVLIHEIGHYLGFDHEDSDVLALMDTDLDAGQRLELAHTDGNEVADDHRPALFFDEDSGVFVSQANKHAKKQHSIFEEDDEWLVV